MGKGQSEKSKEQDFSVFIFVHNFFQIEIYYPF